MRKWSIPGLVLAALAQYGIANAQELGIPQAPGEEQAPAATEREGTAAQEETTGPEIGAAQEASPGNESASPEPVTPPPRPAQSSATGDQALDQPRSDAPMREQIPVVDPANNQKARPVNSSAAPGPISDHVRAATADLDIDDATRARYRWRNGEWWFQTKSGQWRYYRDNEWHAFDPTTYEMQPGVRGQELPRTYATDGDPLPTRAANSYSYAAPSYQAVPPMIYRPSYYDGGYYDRGYYPGDRYYRGPRGVGSVGSRYYHDYGYRHGTGYGPRYRDGYYGGNYYSPGRDRYYGYDGYGRGYSIDGDRYRGGVIGSEIGGRIGGRSGAILGGIIGAEAAD